MTPDEAYTRWRNWQLKRLSYAHWRSFAFYRRETLMDELLRLTITVDCDNDAVEFRQEDTHGTQRSVIRMSVTHPSKVLTVLENLLHILDVKDVTLQQQSDGQLSDIAEW
jgi:hypothetical protein